MMYGTLLPAPIIWKRAAAEMRAAQAAGHEVAIHGWDHVQYHDLLDRKSRQWLSDWYANAHEAFQAVFGEFGFLRHDIIFGQFACRKDTFNPLISFVWIGLDHDKDLLTICHLFIPHPL
jgi:hypothetical protein